jgi:predicted Zn-dependent protease
MKKRGVLRRINALTTFIMNHFRKSLLFVAVFLVAELLAGCKSVPITGRKQIAFVPQSELLGLSASSYREVLDNSKLSSNTEQVELIRRVGNKIKEATIDYLDEMGQHKAIADFEWEFNLIDSDQINAWAMPGGKIAFYTGILEICRDEEGVAAVMGHEMAHVIANHSGERMSQGLVQNFGMGIFAAALRQNPTATKQILLQSAGVISTGGMLAFSRTHESEADEIGLYLMAKAGYNPRAAIDFWERMEAATGGNRSPEFLSTHPSPGRRVQQLNAHMPKALMLYRNSPQFRNQEN